MLESTDFYYNGIFSGDMGVINCNVGVGLYQEMFIPEKEIFETKVRSNPVPFLQGVEYKNPTIIKVKFAFLDPWDDAKIRSVARWLNTENYVPFYTTLNPQRVYYVMPTGTSQLEHNGCQQGMITLDFKADSPFAYMPQVNQTVSSTPTSATPTISNLGDLSIKPEIQITKIGAGDITITNTTNSNQSFTITGLVDNEVVYINCNTEEIITNLSGIYRYSAFSGNFLELLVNDNVLNISGSCTVLFRFQPRLLQGV